jgi:two-component system, cell cycle sensor histidine kinase and response regulator CckA
MAEILVVDDDAAQLEVRRCVLEAGGHHVLLACGPSEAARQLASANLVVMDLRFPNLSGDADAAEGLNLIRRIRQSRPGMPVIVLCGWPQELEGTPEERLVSRIMPKPVGMAVLLDAIGQLLTAIPAPSQSLPSTSP